MIGFILTIALLNTGVGFAAGVYLGWRHRHLVAVEMDSSQASFPDAELFPTPAATAAAEPFSASADEALSQDAIDSAVGSAGESAVDSPMDGEVFSPDEATDSAADAPADPSTVESPPESGVGSAAGPELEPGMDSAVRSGADSAADAVVDSAAVSPADSQGDPRAGSARGPGAEAVADAAAPAASPAVAPATAAGDVKSPTVPASESEAPVKAPPESVEPWSAPDPRESAETAVIDLRRQVQDYQEQVIDIDGLLRQLSEAPDAPKVQECAKTFEDVSDRYLKARGDACETLQQAQDADALGETVLEELRAAVDTQVQRIESARATMRSIDYQDDLAKACQQMAGQTATVANANHALRDALDRTWTAGAAAQQWQPPTETPRVDGMWANMADQNDLEAALARWRVAEAQATRPLCMAAIDLDGCGRLNEEHGPMTGDRVLHAVAQLIVREGSHNNVVGRVSGQRFVVLFPETDLRLTTSVVERIRQMVEKAHFYHGKEEIRATVSCAIVEANPHDEFAALLVRANAAVQEAKRYGRNRTFLYEGEYPTPVVPPNFALSEKSITL